MRTFARQLLAEDADRVSELREQYGYDRIEGAGPRRPTPYTTGGPMGDLLTLMGIDRRDAGLDG